MISWKASDYISAGVLEKCPIVSNGLFVVSKLDCIHSKLKNTASTITHARI